MISVDSSGWLYHGQQPICHLSFLGFDEHGERDLTGNPTGSATGWDLTRTWPNWAEDPRLAGAIADLIGYMEAA